MRGSGARPTDKPTLTRRHTAVIRSGRRPPETPDRREAGPRSAKTVARTMDMRNRTMTRAGGWSVTVAGIHLSPPRRQGTRGCHEPNAQRRCPDRAGQRRAPPRQSFSTARRTPPVTGREATWDHPLTSPNPTGRDPGGSAFRSAKNPRPPPATAAGSTADVGSATSSSSREIASGGQPRHDLGTELLLEPGPGRSQDPFGPSRWFDPARPDTAPTARSSNPRRSSPVPAAGAPADRRRCRLRRSCPGSSRRAPRPDDHAE